MISDRLIKKYSIDLLKFKHAHSVGSILSFDHPCIGFIKKGMGNFLYKGRAYFAHAGDLVYIAKGTRYYSVWSGTPDIEFYSINYDFCAPYDFYGFRFQIVRDFPGRGLDKFYQYFGKNNLLALSYFYESLDLLYSMMEEQEAMDNKGSVSPAIAYIEDNFSKPITISELARLCHYSESQLFKAFRAATGVSPIQYKHNILVQHALDMLTHTGLSIEEISAKLGFSSSNYFRKVFFKITGKTPKEVQKSR